MSWKKRLRVVFTCMTLEMGVLFGVPMRPDQIKELMHQMNQPKLAHVLKEEADGGEGGNEGDEGNGSKKRSHEGNGGQRKPFG